MISFKVYTLGLDNSYKYSGKMGLEWIVSVGSSTNTKKIQQKITQLRYIGILRNNLKELTSLSLSLEFFNEGMLNSDVKGHIGLKVIIKDSLLAPL